MNSVPRVIVVGGGAAGLMAAGTAAECGAAVLLLEKMPRLGRKLLITGNGRCNLTNDKDLDTFISMFGPNGRFLYHAFGTFFRDDLVNLLGRFGIQTITETDGRIFPGSNNARDVVATMERFVGERGVLTITGMAVSEVLVRGDRVVGVRAGAHTHDAEAVILATGGMSYPWTGSSGEGHHMASDLGHTIVPLRPAAVPIEVFEREQAISMQGVSFHDVRLTSFQCAARDIKTPSPHIQYGRGISGKRPRRPIIESRRGDLMFTHYGIGGPVTLQMSLAIVDALASGSVSISIDLRPDTETDALRAELQGELDHRGRRRLSSILSEWLPERVANAVLQVSGIDGRKPSSQVTSVERDRLVDITKSLKFNIKGPLPISQAMVTAGGVKLDEIDPRTMASKIIKGLYFCGELMDLDAETGGYNLQSAFSTGYLAGESAASFLSIG